MTMQMNVIEVPLSDEQTAELDAAKGDPDAVDTILKRIADEIMEQQDKLKKEAILDTLREVGSRLRSKLMTDAMLCIHYLMHAGRTAEAQTILCPVAAILEGEKIPTEVFHALLEKLDAINLEREKASCEGCA